LVPNLGLELANAFGVQRLASRAFNDPIRAALHLAQQPLGPTRVVGVGIPQKNVVFHARTGVLWEPADYSRIVVPQAPSTRSVQFQESAMKRCPQCEFIYEDDQSLCDMDGVLLVFDSRSLPNLHALAAGEIPATPRVHWRHRTFPAMAALILATVLSLVYFVSTQQTRPVMAPLPASVPTPISVPSLTTPSATDATTASDQTPTSPVSPEVNATAATATKDDKKSDPTKTTTAPAAKKATAKAPSTQPALEEPKKEDSKVGSILKKTGRLLKKPFKL
jgi:hypothetical protein